MGTSNFFSLNIWHFVTFISKESFGLYCTRLFLANIVWNFAPQKKNIDYYDAFIVF
jgi:hypothetical protein